MATNDFDTHLQNVGIALEQFNEARSALEDILSIHNHNNYNALVSGVYTGRVVTKAQYDDALSSIVNLFDTWLPAGHGTNFDKYLYEIPTP
jgi:hypothetical protein